MAQFRLLADVTLSTSEVASKVLIWFVLQDRVLFWAWACKDIGDKYLATQ